MTHLLKNSLILIVISALAFSTLGACKKKGPMEKAGESIDNAVEETGDAIKDATN